jgi:hypothetical protein
LNVHNVSDVRQREVHTAEPLVPGPSRLEVEIAIAKLKMYKSPGSDQIPAELIQAGGEILLSEIHKLDRLCGLVVRVFGYRSGGPGSIPGTTKKK